MAFKLEIRHFSINGKLAEKGLETWTVYEWRRSRTYHKIIQKFSIYLILLRQRLTLTCLHQKPSECDIATIKDWYLYILRVDGKFITYKLDITLDIVAPLVKYFQPFQPQSPCFISSSSFAALWLLQLFRLLRVGGGSMKRSIPLLPIRVLSKTLFNFGSFYTPSLWFGKFDFAGE